LSPSCQQIVTIFWHNGNCEDVRAMLKTEAIEAAQRYWMGES